MLPHLRTLRVREVILSCLHILTYLDTPMLSCLAVDATPGPGVVLEQVLAAVGVKARTLGILQAYVIRLRLDFESRSVNFNAYHEPLDIATIGECNLDDDGYDFAHPHVLNINLMHVQGEHLANELIPLLLIDGMRSLAVYGRTLNTSFWTRLYERTRRLTHLFVGCGLQDEAFAEELLRERAVENEDEDITYKCVLPRLRALAVMDYQFAEREPRAGRHSHNDGGESCMPCTLIDALRKRAEKGRALEELHMLRPINLREDLESMGRAVRRLEWDGTMKYRDE